MWHHSQSSNDSLMELRPRKRAFDATTEASQKTVFDVKKAIYQCTKCSKILYTLSGFRNHLQRTHATESIYQCNTCSKKFKHASGLCQHRRRYHEDDPLICVVCEAPFLDRGNLKRHLKTHAASIEEHDQLWKNNYLFTDKQKKAYERNAKKTPEIKIEPTEPPAIPLIFKAENAEELRDPKLPRTSRLRLGMVIHPTLARFRDGKRFNLPFIDRDDPSFYVHTCSSCPKKHFSRRQYEDHLKECHPLVLEANNFCEMCMKNVKDMAQHIAFHQVARQELDAVSIFPNMLTSCLG